MARNYIGNLKGPKGNKGDQGDQGLPGVNAVPTDTAIAANLANPTPTETQAALRRRSKTNVGVYAPTDLAGLRWRRIRDRTLADAQQAHIVVLGDSIGFGGGGSGSTPPKHVSSWPGRLRATLTGTHGQAGTGVVIADANIRANPTWDPRFTFAGTVTDQGFGFHQAACFRLAAGSGTLDFTAVCDEFVLYTLASGGGAATVQVDGGTARTIRNYNGGATPFYEKESGYHTGQIVTRIPAGALGSHTLRVTPPAASFDTFVVGVEGRAATAGGFRVSNASINGKSLQTFLSAQPDVESTGLSGLPMIDMIRPDLLVVALGINDWLTGQTVADTKTRLVSVITRQRESGTNAGGGTKPAGDVIIAWNPQPDLSTLSPSSGSATWAQFRDMYYQVALEQNVPLLDMGARWTDFATGNAAGVFADGIHPNDAGAYDIGSAVGYALTAI